MQGYNYCCYCCLFVVLVAAAFMVHKGFLFLKKKGNFKVFWELKKIQNLAIHCTT